MHITYCRIEIRVNLCSAIYVIVIDSNQGCSTFYLSKRSKMIQCSNGNSYAF